MSVQQASEHDVQQASEQQSSVHTASEPTFNRHQNSVQMPYERTVQMAEERVAERHLEGAAFGVPQRDTREWQQYLWDQHAKRYLAQANPLTAFVPGMVH